MASFEFSELEISGAWKIQPKLHHDSRGYFSRVSCSDEFKKVGLDGNFVQSNLVQNKHKGTFRGFHFQKPPSHEAKLVRCVNGEVLDILIDLRKGSASLLKSQVIQLSAMNGLTVYVPPGVAHGYVTLSDNAIMIYNHSDYYQADLEGGIRYNDPALGLELNELRDIVSISERDQKFPMLSKDFEGLF